MKTVSVASRGTSSITIRHNKLGCRVASRLHDMKNTTKIQWDPVRNCGLDMSVSTGQDLVLDKYKCQRKYSCAVPFQILF